MDSTKPDKLSNLNILFCIYNNMFCDVFSKFFGKNEKKIDKIEDKNKPLENT